MESPAVLLWLAIYLAGPHRFEVTPLALAALWQGHYLYRTFVFPFRLQTTGKRMPLVVPLSGVAFNCLNAYVNARWVSALGGYPPAWLSDPRFLAGTAVFVTGLAINITADNTLLRLRRQGRGYQIPRGGLYERVSCPNYLGEIIEWSGWALATWSLAGLAFALYTIANLAPRALTHHRWYRQKFADYPPARRALVPFLW
jgi:protein-S-isoprenylcysteine O-methyltransferase Ste14